HSGGALALAAELAVPLLGHRLTLDRVAPGNATPGVRLQPVEDGEVFELAGPLPMRVSAIHTPGHARGHLALFEARSRALLCGDMVSTLSTIILDPPEGDLGDY